MIPNNWQPVQSDRPGAVHYQRAEPKGDAYIQRNEDGSAEAESKNGLFGLGTEVESFHCSPAPDDATILGQLDRSAYPDQYDGWKEVKKGPQLPTVKTYEGHKTTGLHSKVRVTIDRDGDRADFIGKVGHFGTEMEGSFFAPAPSDAEILSRLSRNPKLGG